NRIQVMRTADRDRAEAIDRDIGLEWYLRQALTAEEAREWFAAAFYLDQIIPAEPQNAVLRTRRGRVHAEQAQWLQAAAQFAEVARLQPKEIGCRARQAWALLAAERPQESRQILTQMVADFRDHPDVGTAEAIAFTAVLGPDHGITPERLVE